MKQPYRWLAVLLIVQASSTMAQTDTLPPPPLPEVSVPAVPAPGLPAAAPVSLDSADVAALRARFEDLKQRQARDAALREAASEQTLLQIENTLAAMAENEASEQIAAWRAQTFAILAQAFQETAPHVLPAGIAPGTQPDIALAVIDAQATLYAQPVSDAQMVVRSVPDRTTMLRIAESGPFSMVWSAGDGFTFVLSQFRQVY